MCKNTKLPEEIWKEMETLKSDIDKNEVSESQIDTT
jgi:hypothetical protein